MGEFVDKNDIPPGGIIIDKISKGERTPTPYLRIRTYQEDGLVKDRIEQLWTDGISEGDWREIPNAIDQLT